MRVNNGIGWLNSLTLIDQDDLGIAMDVFILEDSTSMGTEGSAISLVDASGLKILGVVSIAASDYIDCIAFQTVTKSNLGMAVASVGGTTNLYAAIVTRGSAQYSASGLHIRFGFIRG